jgi:cell division protein FtsB
VGRTGSAQGPAAQATGGTGRPALPAVGRPVRSHTAQVRAGAVRARPAARAAQPAAPASRPPAGAPGGRVLGAVGAHRAPLVLLVVTLLVATTLGLLFLNTAIAVNSLKAAQLAAANEDRAQEVQRLEQQVIAGGTPAELAEAAREAGMVPAGAAAYLVVGEDGTVTLRGEPVPAEAPEPAETPELPDDPAVPVAPEVPVADGGE